MEYVDPGEARGLLEQAWAGGVVLDYVPVISEEDLGDGEILRRVVLFTAQGLCVVRGLDPGPEIDPSSIPGHRITVDEFYGWRVDRERRRVLMLGYDPVKRDPDRYGLESRASSEWFISAPLDLVQRSGRTGRRRTRWRVRLRGRLPRTSVSDHAAAPSRSGHLLLDR